MYALQVFFANEIAPRHVERLRAASDVLARIPELLAAHDGCEKVVVYFDTTRLFVVDCKGNSSPG